IQNGMRGSAPAGHSCGGVVLEWAATPFAFTASPIFSTDLADLNAVFPHNADIAGARVIAVQHIDRNAHAFFRDARAYVARLLAAFRRPTRTGETPQSRGLPALLRRASGGL